MPSTNHPSSYFTEKAEVVRELSHALYFVFPQHLHLGKKKKHAFSSVKRQLARIVEVEVVDYLKKQRESSDVT